MSFCPTKIAAHIFISQRNLALNFHSVPPLKIKGYRNFATQFLFMAGYKHLKGRPRLKEGKRIKKIDVRFTEQEYNVVLELEKTLGISKTELVRVRLLNDAANMVINAKDLINHFDQIGAELGKSGNNINQLARYVNMLINKQVLSPVAAERFNLLFAQYLENQRLLEAALRKVMRALGK
jgi:hypothetical protein